VRERLELAEQLPATPATPRVTTSLAPAIKASAPPPFRSAPPPVPPRAAADTSYRPKLNANEIKKSLTPAEPRSAETTRSSHDDELPVESQDFVEKSS
jgi:hypothetical protein